MLFLIVTTTTIQIKGVMCTPTGLYYVLPDNSTNVSCPSQPCLTLSQYLWNMSGMSNVKYLFLLGEHSLTSNITMNHVHNVTMVGVDYDNLAPIIFCYSSKAVIIVTYSVNITIANLVLRNCGGIGPTVMPRYDPVQPDDHSKLAAALFFDMCYYCTVMNTTFIGYGLMANNLLGESHLDNITLHLHAIGHSLSYWCNQGIKLINTGKIKNYVSKNLIIVSKITINGSGNNCQSNYQYDIGMRIDLEPTNYNITLILSDSNFHNVNVQPLLQIGLLHGVSSRIMLWVKNCKFQYNNYTTATSETKIPAVSIVISCINVTLYFTSCSFYKNKNANKLPLISIEVINYDLGFMAYQGKFNEPYILPVDWCLFPSYVRIEHSNFIRNSGTLIDMQGMKISGCIIRFSIIGIFNLLRNKGYLENIISIYYATVNIIGEANFSFNSNARNIILFYECTVIFRKNVSFTQNGDFYYDTAVSQVVTLQSDLAYIKIVENTHIKFINNVYSNQAVQVKVENYRPHPFCVFQYGTITPKNASDALLKNYSIIFSGGYKDQLYYTFNDAAIRLSINYYTFHCQWLPKAIFHGYHPADINKQIIKTDDEQMYQHTRVCYCFINNTYDCSLDLLGPVFPGQVLQVDLCVPHESDNDEIFALYVDTHNTFLPNSACKVAHQSEIISTINGSSKTYNFTIVSESENECEIFLTAQPDLYKRYDAFYVRLLPCPIGFTLQNGVCDCDPILLSIINICYIDHSVIRRPANSWIVVHTQTNNTKYLISSNCPMDYCLPYSSDVNLLYPDLQCQFNRTGMLCSQCQHPLSMVFGSSRCIKCTNVHILITIIVIVAGIVLVVLLYVLNLTVTKGIVNGIILYANIVSINDSVFLVNDNVFKPLRVFILFANLDLGIETCFYNGMENYDKMWLQLFFPTYLIIIAISIIIASRYSTRILRLTYTRSLPVLATLFLLSYTGVLRTVLTVLFSYSTITHLPSGHQQLVWSIDASVPLFGLKFTILFITCLVLFLILIFFNFTLLFTRYLMRFRIVYHFKPLLDAFQGSYKDKYYYWVAVHLALRILLFIFYALPTNLKLISSTVLLIIFGIYSGYACPYNYKLVNIQELLLLINLTIIYAVSYEGTHSIFLIVTNIMISLAFFQFSIIILYHFLTYTYHCNVISMLQTTKQKLVMKFCSNQSSSHNSNNIVLLNIPECTYNYAEFRDGLVSDDFN